MRSLAPVHLLNAGLLVLLWWWSWSVFPDLPGRIPGHVGPGGVRWDATTWGSWLVLPAVALAITLLNYGLGPVIRKTRRVNLPSQVRLEDLLPEDQEEVMDLTVRFLHWMNALLVMGLGLLQVGSFQMAVQGLEGMAPMTIVGVIFLLLAPNLATVGFLVLVIRAVGDAERRARADHIRRKG